MTVLPPNADVCTVCSYDVLFQDVDVTWLKDPFPELQADAPYYHIQFMDDGSRRRLNAP